MSNGMLSENAQKIIISRYVDGYEDWEGVCNRVAKAVSDNDNNGNKEYWREKYFDMMFNLKALPGGRVLRNAGTRTGKILQCHVLPLHDSIESIGEFINMALVLNSEGGGVGCHPQLRPKGAVIKKKGGKSTGLLSFLNPISSLLNTVESGGNRRSGLLPILDVSHPEIINFIDSKLDHSNLNNFNISVGVTNKFLDAVEKEEKWNLHFGGIEYETVWAKDIFDKIIANMLTSGEPGLVNIDNMKINNSWYFSPIEGLNLCIHGDMKIALADGRGDVEIRQLAKEGVDVPAYSYNKKTNKTEIQMLRAPRKTGTNKKTIKITTDQGEFIVTKNHRINMYDGTIKQAGDLLPGDSLLALQIESGYISGNMKVIKIEEHESVDVYNCTVDSNHNYYIRTNKSKTIGCKERYDYVNVMNCGELPLPPYTSCCLGSVILKNIISGSNGNRTSWEELSDVLKTLTRFLDNVLDINDYSFNKMKRATLEGRKIGIGVMGLGDYLFAKKARYGSDSGLAKTEELIKFMRNTLYNTSIDLAKEKGPFEKYSKWPYTNAKFIKKLPAKIRVRIKKHGIRNNTIMSFPPTGTISLVADTTSGIEPLMLKAYERTDRVGTRTYIHPVYKKMIKRNIDIIKKSNDEPITTTPDWFVDSLDLSPEEHFETAVSIQSLNDSSISKTQILPEGTKHEQLSDLLLEYSRKLTGITVYMNNSRDKQIYKELSYDEVTKLIESESKFDDELSKEDVACKDGECSL